METKLPELGPDAPPPSETPEKRSSLGNRILGYSFLASVVINLGWLGWVSSSNLFGGPTPLKTEQLKPKMVKIPQKPKPPPPKTPPPPPPPPKHVKPPPPLKTPPKRIIRPQRTPPPPRAAPTPTQQVKVARSPNSKSTAPPMPTGDSTPPGPINPGPPTPTPTPTPPTPPAPIPGPPTPPAPEVKPTPPAPPVHHDPPPPPVHHDPPKPKGWVPIDSQEADPISSVDVSADGIDAGSLTGSEVVVSYTISETGRVTGARVSKSCGNSEMDNRVLEAVRRQHCAPAIQDHLPRESHETLTYSISS